MITWAILGALATLVIALAVFDAWPTDEEEEEHARQR